jgi:hypothetical protein
MKGDVGLYKDLGVTLATVGGDAIEQWNDQSGSNNNLTQLTLAHRPYYNIASGSPYNGKQFPGFSLVLGNNGNLTKSPFILNQPFTVMFNVDLPSLGSHWYPFGSIDNTKYIAVSGAYQTITVNFGTPLIAASVNPIGVISVVVNGASSKIRLNGVDVATGNVGSLGLTDLLVGTTDFPQTLGTNPYLLEMIVHSVRSSDSDISAFEAYVKSKWNWPH